MTNQELVAVIKKNPISVSCGVLCLVLAAGIYFRRDEIPAKEAELAQKSAEGERHALNITNSKNLAEQYDALVKASKEIDARLVRAAQRGANSEFFYQLESDTGVKLLDPQQTGITPPKGKAQFSSVTFSISAQGNLNQLLHFLHQLEGGAHYCRIMSANINISGAKRDSPLTLALNLELLGLP